MRHAPFGRPRHPLGTFPCGKVPRPPAGGRNLPQETDSLWKAGNGPTFLFPASQRISPLRRRPKGFPIALWKPSGAIPVEVNGSHKKWIPCGRQGKELFFLFPFLGRFRLCGGDQGAFRSPPGPLRGPHPFVSRRNLPQETDSLWKARERAFLTFPILQRISPLRGRPGGFPVAPWTPSGGGAKALP